FFFHAKYVAWLIPALRQISSTGVPSSPCRMTNAFWASENFDRFILVAPPQPGKIASKTPVQNEGPFRERITINHLALENGGYRSPELTAPKPGVYCSRTWRREVLERVRAQDVRGAGWRGHAVWGTRLRPCKQI